MELNAHVVTVGGAKSLVFGTSSAEEARDAVLRTAYPTDVSPATESDLAVLSRIELLSLYNAGSVQIRPIGRVRKAGVPRYRHPEDEAKTWTGQGRAPAWFQALLDAGHTKESLAIPGAVDGTDAEDEVADAPLPQNGDFS